MAFSNVLRAFQPLRTSVLRTPASATQYLSRPTFFQRSIATTAPKFLEQPTEQQPQEQPSVETATPTAEAPSSSSVQTEVPPSLRQYAYKLKKGTVISAGRMVRTVRVLHWNVEWDAHLRKYYRKKEIILVSDPRESLRVGDVIEFSSGHPKSRNVHHVVERIIAPFGDPIEDRPAVMTREERDAARAEKRTAKWQRRQARIREAGGNVKGGSPSPEHVGRIRRLIQERQDSFVPQIGFKRAQIAAAKAEEAAKAEAEAEAEAAAKEAAKKAAKDTPAAETTQN
ncbi:uS17 family ribosomal protein [Aspergillus brunneoviolaceus CBS 621.78]|uniref:Nucleic acid-binding protein n=1 Tax=Aspergillus brunneoviolaceus CBS 621.78 TaxID=1450534 RepID=A0ACD1GA85_9EURO|nr:nucleic acid-binding protein [Aspergillus brunneoviolaceus CBS 621.78]RAH46127.1 nucleic acid-binding protein [Aspergillus brunneoviolaceus CBS 621.78]